MNCHCGRDPQSPQILLSTAYLAPVDYYRQLNLGANVIIEKADNYVKQTYRNRCVIATANGLQTLSIPIEKPDIPKCLTRDIRIAEHGNWRNLHWHAIASAYRSSPFFDYYEDDFYPFYAQKQTFLFDFNEQLRQLVCSLLDIAPKVGYSSEYCPHPPAPSPNGEGGTREEETPLSIWRGAGGEDFRETIHPKKPPITPHFRPYYQVFATRYGFQPNLSIIDLLFNMGNEAIVYL
ncbi:MAG: WbqC family protein [Candidatus Symbiothrix sp.]|jgi:hypothetical protein|nr:WbqC family protein [Candidatus Symbiothrix sp.]